MTSAPLVSFITVNYRMREYIRHLLTGFVDARIGFPFEYFLVDNASGDGVLDLVGERFPWATPVAAHGNIGFGAGNNCGIRRARGKYVMLLNPDLTILPSEIDRWVAWMEAHPDVGISGPRVVNPDGTDQDSCYRFPGLFTPLMRRTILGKTPWGRASNERYLMKEMDRAREQDVDWVLGAAMLIRREVFDRTGDFDPRFFMYFEDADLCRRAWEAGWRVTYTPEARMMHYHQRQSRTRYVWHTVTNRLTRIHIASGVKYFLKYCGKTNPRIYACAPEHEHAHESATNA